MKKFKLAKWTGVFLVTIMFYLYLAPKLIEEEKEKKITAGMNALDKGGWPYDYWFYL